jgi:ATP-binding cassette subfamily B protein
MKTFRSSFRKTGIILKTAFLLSTPLIFLIPIISVIEAVIPFVNYVFTSLILDGLTADAGETILFLYAGCGIGANIFLLLLKNVCNRVRDTQMYRMELEFEKKVSVKMMDLDYARLESNYVQDLKRSIDQLKMRVGGIGRIMGVFSGITRNIISLILAFLSFLKIFQMRSLAADPSFWTSPLPLALLLLISFLLLFTASRLQLKVNWKIVNLNDQLNRANGSGFMFMQLMGDYHFGKDIRIYNLKEFLCSSFEKLWNSSIGLKLMKDLGRTKASIPCLTAALNSLVIFLSYLLAAFKAINKEISVGSVVLYAGSIQVFISSISALIYSLGDLVGSCEQMSPYIELFAIQVCESQGTEPVPVEDSEQVSFTIEFQDVSFRYPNTDIWALRHVNLTICLGERIAVVGMNGSGKTTLIKLLCRLYEPTEGTITLNGRNIHSIKIDEYRRLFGVVFQDYQLFSFTLGQNVAVSKIYQDHSVYDALDKAGILSWAEGLPKKLETVFFQDFEEGGVEISGGEAQKVAIARAVYKQAHFLILDEPTAALDPRAEYTMYENIHQLVEGSGIVYISHRLSSCKFCSRILVFHEGQIVQTGSHDKLVQDQTGKYYEMWNAQAQFYQ